MSATRTSTSSTIRSLVALAISISAPLASAQFTVTELYDAPAVNAAVSPDAEAPVPGIQSTLRSVIQHINTLPPGTYTVSIPSGAYLLSFTGHGENNAVRGDIDVYRDIEITGAGLGSTFIFGDVLGDRIFDVRAPVRLSLAQLGLYNGTAVPGGAGQETGGAIRAMPGSIVEIREVEFSGNSASGGPSADAGAIDAMGDLIANGYNNFFNNTATGFGGAIQLGGTGQFFDAHFEQCKSDRAGGAVRVGSSSPSLTINSSFFRDNESGGAGGAMDLRGPATIDHTLFEGNRSVGVGGAFSANAAVTVMDSQFFLNHADSGGGAFNVAGLGDVTVRDCALQHNVALTSGGVLLNSAHCEIWNSSLAYNICEGSIPGELGGGAIYNFGDLEIVNSTISENTNFQGYGGGILNLTGGNMILTHVTIHNNNAPVGSNIHNGTPSGGAFMQLNHSIISTVAGVNPGTTGTSLPLASIGYNLDSDGTAGLAAPGDISGSVPAPVDALLSPLAPHGGNTLSHVLLPQSPCRDSGDATLSFDHTGVNVLVDQRHEPRPVYHPDRGAVEMPCVVDLVAPFGVLNFFDLVEFINLYNNQDPRADLAAPIGVWNFFDIVEFITIFNNGC